MNKQVESKQAQSKPKLYTLLEAVKFAYGQYKLDLKYVKNTSNFWEGKPYRFAITHLAIAKHRIKHFVLSIMKLNINKCS
tara:strand:+ start:357 stop:596 length:240 start_codon:yes stop_codon:yes gene_type:complete